MSIKIGKKIILVLVVACLVSIPVASALSQLFQQTFPSQTVPSAAITAQCASLNLNGTTVSETSGNLLYDCTNGAQQQLYAWYATANNSITPIFTLPSVYTALYLVSSASQCPSQGTPTGLLLTNGTSFTVNTRGVGGISVADYCLSYSATFGATLPSFSIIMKQ